MTPDEFVERWATSFGAGWAPLLATLARGLGPQERASARLKEKYGALRTSFVCGATDAAWDYGDLIERESSTICEQCGAAGRTNTQRGWYKTLCPDHWDIPTITSYPPRRKDPS